MWLCPRGIKVVQCFVALSCAWSRSRSIYPELGWGGPRLGEGVRNLSSSCWCKEELDEGEIPPWHTLHPCPRSSLIPGQGCGLSTLISLLSGELRALMLHLCSSAVPVPL